ncbi:MAG: hypothetical protein WD708_12965 [Kiritimatiellia bacterium]
MTQVRKKVVRMLALGGRADDRIFRLTRGRQYVCCQGSEAEHQQLSGFCEDLHQWLHSTGQSIEEYSPDELSALLAGWFDKESTQ